jgi:arginine repressor
VAIDRAGVSSQNRVPSQKAVQDKLAQRGSNVTTCPELRDVKVLELMKYRGDIHYWIKSW